MSAEHRSPVPDWLVERLAKGDLPAAEAGRVRARLEAEPGGQERLARIAASDAEILAALPPAMVAAEVERRRAGAERAEAARRHMAKRPAFWVGLALPLAGAAVFAVMLGRGEGPLGPTGLGELGSERIEEGRVKGDGDPVLLVFRQKGREVERLREGASARPGDTLQVRYVAGKASHGLIVSLDAHGEVTAHLPEQLPAGAMAVQLDRKGVIDLPHAFELDATPGFERFVFVTSAHPFAAAPVVDALRAGRALAPELRAVTLTLKKDTP